MDSLDKFSFMVQKDDILAVDNLDSGYWHVPLQPSQYPPFGVSIYDELEKKTHYYQWVVLFLGLSDAVHISTKLLLPVVKHLRSCGWEGIFYIDNLGTLGRSNLECLYCKYFVREILGRAGWVINTSKDQEPAQDNILLGSVVDTINLKYQIPLAKIEEIKNLILKLLQETQIISSLLQELWVS